MIGALKRLRHFVAAKIERKLAAALLGSLAVVSVIFLVIFVVVYQFQLIGEHERAASQINQLLQASLENAMLKRDIPGLTRIVDQLGRQAEIASVRIVNPRRQVRFSSHDDLVGSELDSVDNWPIGSEPPMSASTEFVRTSDGTSVLRSINPVRNRAECGQCHGGVADNPVNGVLIVDYRADGVARRAWAGASAMTASGLIVALCAMLAIWAAMRRFVLAPVHRVEQSSSALAAGDLSARASLGGHDELAMLGARFDAMADRLSETIRSLRDSGRFVQAVIDAVPDGVRVISSDYRILKANRAYCEQTGASPDEVVGMFCYESSHRRDSPCPATLVACPLAKFESGEQTTLKCQQRHVRSDGSAMFVEVSAAWAEIVIDGKNEWCVIESIRDLAQQAEYSHQERLAGLATLAAGVAHEIHNPLSSIRLALQALELDVAGSGADEASGQYLAAANREIENCLEITARLLRMSEPSTDDLTLVSLPQIARDITSLLSYQSRQNGIEVDVDFSGTPRVLAAESDIRIVVLNLIQNAFHAMPDGGTLKVSGRAQRHETVIEFCDTGVGIAPENREKVFWPFWSERGDATHGSGLGLSICRSIVQRYGGSIRLIDMPGFSACFEVRLANADLEESE